MRTKIVLSLLLLAVAVVLAACGKSGSDTPAPTVEALLTQSAKALQQQTSVGYHMQAKVSATPVGSSSDQSVQVDMKGGASTHAFTAEGKAGVSGMGQDLSQEFAVKAADSQLYVQIGGQWYGDQAHGLKDLKMTAKQTAQQQQQALPKGTLPQLPTQLSPQQLQQLLVRYRPQLITASVSSGEVDGTSTWDVPMQINVQGAKKLVQQYAPQQQITDAQWQALSTLATGLKVTVSFGQKDSLPYRIQVQFKNDDVPALEAAMREPGQPAQAATAKAISLDMTLTMSQWGKPVTITTPANVRPLTELTGQFGINDLVGGAGGLAVPGQSTDPAPPTVTNPTTDQPVPVPVPQP